MTTAELYTSPNALARYYQRFRVSERILLTGHSHQAWPDCGFEAQQQAWLDAAEHVDHKWDMAFEKAERVRQGYARILDDDSGHYALASNTHDLVLRFLSALPFRKRPTLVTTDGEYHSIRRQLDRLEEEGIRIVRVPVQPLADLADRIVDAVATDVAAVMMSSVLYRTSEIVGGLNTIHDRCQEQGAAFLVDAYHMVNVVPLSVSQQKLDRVFIVGGGYKYCQLGEGNCFLRFPRDCRMRPAITGWFSEFSALAQKKTAHRVVYGDRADLFAGSTYDPVSHYRAASVFDFFEQQGLTPAILREVSQHQVGTLVNAFDAQGFDASVIDRDRALPLEGIGGFLALRAPQAERISQLLLKSGVHTDYRADILRLGPAPYLSDRQLLDAIDVLRTVVNQL